MIIRRGRIAAAGCTLPLTDSPNIGANIHTRHKAAIGITEQSDCVVVVVSEETGIYLRGDARQSYAPSS